MNAAVCLCHPIWGYRICGGWRIFRHIIIVCDECDGIVIMSMLLHCGWWKCDCNAFNVVSLCLSPFAIANIHLTRVPYTKTLSLSLCLSSTHTHVGFFYLFGHSEYIMLYNIIYKLHRINLCHLRHMNFTVYAHFRKNGASVLLFCSRLLILLLLLLLSFSHSLSLRVLNYFNDAAYYLGSSVCHLHWWTKMTENDPNDIWTV